MRQKRYSDEQILDELRRVGAMTGGRLSRPQFVQYGTINPSTIVTRFGSWLGAVKIAGLGTKYAHGGQQHKCLLCGTMFRSNNGVKARRYCSPGCTKQAQRVNKPNYLGNAASRAAARGRSRSVIGDPSNCSRCGVSADDARVERHHRNRDVFDNTPENLIALCTKCHKKEHGTTERQRAARRANARKLNERRACAFALTQTSQTNSC